MLTRALTVAVCLGGLAAPIRADEPAARHQPITPETVAAYEKAGATYGTFDTSNGTIPFTPGTNAATGQLFGFRFKTLSAGALIGLPAVSTPFGLDLHDAGLTDADLKGLGGRTALVALNLRGNVLTDAAVRELEGLTNLTALDLGATSVTDTGLKSLNRMSKLSVLGLERTRVTDTGLGELSLLKSLTTVNVKGTQVTEPGIELLGEFLPKLRSNAERLRAEKAKPEEPGGLNFATLPKPAPEPVALIITDKGVELAEKAGRRERSPQTNANSSDSSPTSGYQPPPTGPHAWLVGLGLAGAIAGLVSLVLVVFLGWHIGRTCAARPAVNWTIVGMPLAGALAGSVGAVLGFLVERVAAGTGGGVTDHTAVGMIAGLGAVFGMRGYLNYQPPSDPPPG